METLTNEIIAYQMDATINANINHIHEYSFY